MTPEGLKRTPPAADPGLSGASAAAPEVTGDARPAKNLSIAVLPFADMSPEHDQEYFSDGLSEELLNQLAQIGKLRVIGRTSSFAFKGQNRDLREIGEKLGVAHVLEGSVRKAADQLRITAQLIDAGDGAHLWSHTYDRRLEDIFAIQDDIAHAVAEALKVTLGVGETAASSTRTDNVELYDLYLRARGLYHSGGPADFQRAAELYREILARDAGYGPARAGLVIVLHYSLIFFPERVPEFRHALEAVVEDGAAQAPEDWSTYLARGVLHWQRQEWLDADHTLAAAEAHAPRSHDEIDELRPYFQLCMGRAEDSTETLRARVSGDPLSIPNSIDLQIALTMAGRSDEAEAEYQRSRDLPHTREDPETLALFRDLGSGDAALVNARFDRYLSRQNISLAWIPRLREVYDDPDAALAVIRAADSDPGSQDTMRRWLLSLYAGYYGDAELAFAALRRSVELESTIVLKLWFPQLAAARRLPAFKDIVRDLGLVDYWRETGNWGDFCRPLGDDDFECF
jgi:TolB-like protein